MAAFARTLRQSLAVRLAVLLCLAVAAILMVYALWSFRSTREHFLGLVRTEIHRSSDLIVRATHDGMLLNRLDDVQRTLERLADGHDLTAVRVYDKDGRVALSGEAGEIGRRLEVEAAPCIRCHTESAAGVVPADRLVIDPLPLWGDVAGGHLRHLSVIENDPGCAGSGCHAGADARPVLGVLEVEMAMTSLGDALNATRRQVVVTTLVLLAVTSAVVTLFVRRVVHDPVTRLYAGTRRIAAGELETRIDVRGVHELARLAEAFNHMAEDLAEARRDLLSWSENLEERVAEKTAELREAESQVLHMEKMASLGQLAATVAHELNNPLGAILSYARLVKRELRDQPLGEEARAEIDHCLEIMQGECVRSGQIVRNLLTFARRSGSEMSPVDLAEILDRSLMLVRHLLEQSGIGLDVERRLDDPRLVADAGQLEQALVALLVNAAEAMAEGSGERSLRVFVAGDLAAVRIEIADTGSGISAENLPHIFEPFFSTKIGESGVGLGLAVVYGIVHRHGGTIDVESEPGRGALFRLRLPRRPPELEEKEEKAV